jgi:TP901 family phage tail tape measure protein
MAGRFTTVGIELVIRRMGQWTKGMATIRRQMGLTGTQTNRMSKQFKGASSAILNFGNNVRNVGNQVLILGFQLTFLASGAMAAFISKAIDFEKSMVKIITLVGVAEHRVAQWAEQLLEIGPALGKSPNELAEALFVITSAGIRDQAEAIDVLTSSARAASIGLGETEAVARVLTGAMQAYEDTNLSAAEATDILVATVREGNLEVESLAPTLGRVIATAANMGVTFAEVGAFIATFTRTAVPAEVAVTSLRSALNSLLKPTESSKSKLAEYGVTIEDVWESIADPERGLAHTLLSLSAIFGDNNEEMAEVIASQRALGGVFTVTGGLAEEYVEILNNIQQSLGITDEAFERFTKTTAFMGARAKASFDSLAISIGAVLLPGVNKLLDVLVPLFDAMKDFADLHPKITILAGAFGAFVTILGPLLIVSGLLVSSLGTLIIAIGAFVTFIGTLIGPIGLFVAAIGSLFAGIAVAIGLSLGKAKKKLREEGLDLSKSAFNWGKNIILSLAKGMGAAAAAVTRVLIIIGNHIRRLLVPGSPPKLLPGLEDWGQGAMESWIDGFLKADFDRLTDVAGLAERAIRSLDHLIPEEDLIPTIIGSRAGIAEILEQVRTTGSVTEEALRRVFSSMGRSNSEFSLYIQNLIDMEKASKDVADAQKELTKIQDDFAKALKPVNEEIKTLVDRRQDIIDQLRQEEIQQEILDDPDAPALAKELARMELRHILLQQQKRDVEEQRDVEVDAAKLRVTAAEKALDTEEERVSVAKSFIDVQIRNNELLKEHIKLLDEDEKKLKDVGEDIEDFFEHLGLPDLDFGIGKIDVGGDEDGEDGPGLFENIQEEINKVIASVEEIVAEAKKAFIDGFGDTTIVEELTDVWSDILVEAAKRLETGELEVVLRAFFIGAITGAVSGISAELDRRLKLELVRFFQNLFTTAKRFLVDIPGKAIGALIDFFSGKEDVPTTLRDYAEAMLEFVEAARELINLVVPIDIQPLFDFVDFLLEATGVAGLLDEAVVNLTNSTDAPGGVGTGSRGLRTAFMNAAAWADIFRKSNEEAAKEIKDDLSPEIIDNLTGKALRGSSGLIPAIDDVEGKYGSWKIASEQDLQPSLQGLNDFLVTNLGPEIGTNLFGVIEDVIGKFTDWKDIVKDEAQKALEALEGFLGVDFSTTITNVSDFLKDTFTPEVEFLEEAWDSLKEALEGPLTRVFDAFTLHVLTPLETAVGNIKTKVGELVTKILELLKWLPFVKVPDDLAESSPSAFEQSLRNTIAAMTDMADIAAPGLGAALRGNLGSFVAGNATRRGGRVAVQPLQGAGTVNHRTAHINLGGQNINNGMDAAGFQALVEKAMRNSI